MDKKTKDEHVSDSEYIDNKVFLKKDDLPGSDTVDGKLSMTNIFEVIPENATNKPLDNWRERCKSEWRWRFLKFNNKQSVEISCLHYNTDKRLYINKKGEWVHRKVDPIFDKFVIKEFYYYTT